MSGIVDQSGIFVAARGIEHQHGFLFQHVGKADDGVERRAQFVTHGGEEAALGGVGALGLGARLFQRAVPEACVPLRRAARQRLRGAHGRRLRHSTVPAAGSAFRSRHIAAAHRACRRHRTAPETRPTGSRPTPRYRQARSDKRADRRHGPGRTGHGRASQRRRSRTGIAPPARRTAARRRGRAARSRLSCCGRAAGSDPPRHKAARSWCAPAPRRRAQARRRRAPPTPRQTWPARHVRSARMPARGRVRWRAPANRRRRARRSRRWRRRGATPTAKPPAERPRARWQQTR